MWHHTRTKLFGYHGPYEHFVEKLFLPGEVESGSWWEYVNPFFNATSRYLSNTSSSNASTSVLTIWYEDLQFSSRKTLFELANFLEISLTESRADEILRQCSLQVMKENEINNGLLYGTKIIHGSDSTGTRDEPCRNQIREGKVGGWKEYLSEELNHLFDQHHRMQVTLLSEGKVENEESHEEEREDLKRCGFNYIQWESEVR
jgi:hypothetical protein